MKTFNLLILFPLIYFFSGCTKDKNDDDSPENPGIAIAVPNGGFESWDSMPVPLDWNTNSCPPCMTPYESYIVRRDPQAFTGQFAAKFIYNNVYASYGQCRFTVPYHPVTLNARVKCNVAGGDMVSIRVSLYHNASVIDSGAWTGTTTISSYTHVVIPITQSSTAVDSAVINIVGGSQSTTTELWVDDMVMF